MSDGDAPTIDWYGVFMHAAETGHKLPVAVVGASDWPAGTITIFEVPEEGRRFFNGDPGVVVAFLLPFFQAARAAARAEGVDVPV